MLSSGGSNDGLLPSDIAGHVSRPVCMSGVRRRVQALRRSMTVASILQFVVASDGHSHGIISRVAPPVLAFLCRLSDCANCRLPTGPAAVAKARIELGWPLGMRPVRHHDDEGSPSSGRGVV